MKVEQTLSRAAATQSDGARASARRGHVNLTAGQDIGQIRRPHIHTLVRGADVGGRDAQQTLCIHVPAIYVSQAGSIDPRHTINDVAAGRQAADRRASAGTQNSHRRQRQIAALRIQRHAIDCGDRRTRVHNQTAHRGEPYRTSRGGNPIRQG